MGKEVNEADEPSSEQRDETIKEEDMLSYDEKLKFVSPIAKPMAPRKLTKKIYKLIKKASKDKKNFLKLTGLKGVQRELRKDSPNGIIIFAGDVLPLDIMSHLPVLCEDRDIPYCYVPSRRDLGQAMGVARPIHLIMIQPRPEYQEMYDELKDAIKMLPPPA